jgi:hypothetical protein
MRPELRWQFATVPMALHLKPWRVDCVRRPLRCTFLVGREAKTEIPPLWFSLDLL